MTRFDDIALQGRMSSFKKSVLIVLAVALIIGVGVLIAIFVKQDQEFKRNNFGVFDITLSNSGATVLGKDKASVEYTNLKIGQKESFKFGFKLSSCTREQEEYQVEENGEMITKYQPNGVYVKFIVTGEVYDVTSSGERQINEDYCKKLNNVISSSCYATRSWDKNKNEFTYCASKNSDDYMRIGEGEEYFSNAEIVMYFNSAIVDATWWEKIVVINVQLVAVDAQSLEGASWKL